MMEEESLNSAMNKALSSKETTPSCEESGWTTYFDDLLSTQRREPSASSFDLVAGSLVSDAASFAQLKVSNQVESKKFKKLSFKKRRTRGVLDDDPLEDTASSPVNSPKLSEMKQLGVNTSKKDDYMGSSKEKGTGSSEVSQFNTVEGNEMGFIGKDTDNIELKKRGLCLVPLSLLVNYLG